MELDEKLDLACGICRSFFSRGMGSGTSGNMSFMHDGRIYITASGTCFGFLRPEDFACIDTDGTIHGDLKPSKELPLHAALYRHDAACGAVIHIHSTYSVLWSCLDHENEKDCIPDYTPYLRMKLGSVSLVDYARPGSQDLLEALMRRIDDSDGWLLRNHGLLVPGKDIMGAFAAAEELEESCRVAWELRNTSAKLIR